MSASIPLALGVRCPLIMSKAWVNYYCLKSPIKLCDNPTSPVILTKDMFTNVLPLVQEEFHRQKQYKNDRFNTMISAIRGT
jgi:hypothetical protein